MTFTSFHYAFMKGLETAVFLFGFFSPWFVLIFIFALISAAFSKQEDQK